jgi:hypothetical protein
VTRDRLTDIRLRAAAAQARRQELEDQAAVAEQRGLTDLAGKYRDARTGLGRPRLTMTERLALSDPPPQDSYIDARPVGDYEVTRRLAIIGDRPGHLIGTVRTQLRILDRAIPGAAAPALAVLDRLDPADRRGDMVLIAARQALGRAMALGWPAKQVRKVIRDLDRLKTIT